MGLIEILKKKKAVEIEYQSELAKLKEKISKAEKELRELEKTDKQFKDRAKRFRIDKSSEDRLNFIMENYWISLTNHFKNPVGYPEKPIFSKMAKWYMLDVEKMFNLSEQPEPKQNPVSEKQLSDARKKVEKTKKELSELTG